MLEACRHHLRKRRLSHLTSNVLLRGYALGVDARQLLIAKQPPSSNELIINGLTGTLTIGKTDAIKRQLAIARFTHNGIEPE